MTAAWAGGTSLLSAFDPQVPVAPSLSVPLLALLDRDFETWFDEYLASLPIPLAESHPTPRTEIDRKIRRKCDWDRSDERRTIDGRHRTSLKVKMRLLIESTVYDYCDSPFTSYLVAVTEDRAAPLYLRVYLSSLKNRKMYSVAPGANRYWITVRGHAFALRFSRELYRL
jgi:hypothetical protein